MTTVECILYKLCKFTVSSVSGVEVNVWPACINLSRPFIYRVLSITNVWSWTCYPSRSQSRGLYWLWHAKPVRYNRRAGPLWYCSQLKTIGCGPSDRKYTVLEWERRVHLPLHQRGGRGCDADSRWGQVEKRHHLILDCYKHRADNISKRAKIPQHWSVGVETLSADCQRSDSVWHECTACVFVEREQQSCAVLHSSSLSHLISVPEIYLNAITSKR